MKTVYVSNSLIPSRSANSVHVMKMCHALAQLGIDVTLLARHGPLNSTDICQHYGVSDCFELVRLPWPAYRGGGIRYGQHVRRWLRQRREPDILYGRCLYGLLASKRMDNTLAYEAHTPPPTAMHAWMLKRLFFRESFAKLAVISHALKHEYQRLFPWLSGDKLVVLPDAADPPPEESSISPIAFPEARGGKLQVGYVGHLYPGKGAEIIAALGPEMPDVDFHIVGGTPEDVSQWRGKLSSSNLHLHGYVPHGQVWAFLRQLDILVAPYQHSVRTAGGKADIAQWMSPLKLFEYMAAGRAIVASDLPVLREVLRPGYNAVLCKPDDLPAWKQAIWQLQEDEPLRNRLGQAARREFLRHYTWERRASRLLAELGVTMSPDQSPSKTETMGSKVGQEGRRSR